uniref:(northern house mosquito) hypothetical protein n=1 Tax=Culex pipiens TaxID=7175 RepID=A0A8D8AHI8_CULPI
MPTSRTWSTSCKSFPTAGTGRRCAAGTASRRTWTGSWRWSGARTANGRWRTIARRKWTAVGRRRSRRTFTRVTVTVAVAEATSSSGMAAIRSRVIRIIR